MFPLWKRTSDEIIKEFIGLGFLTVVVCVNEKYLDPSFAGRVIDEDFQRSAGMADPAVKNESFTFVFDGPVFKKKIDYRLGRLVHRTYKTKIENNDQDNDGDETNRETTFWYRDIL